MKKILIFNRLSNVGMGLVLASMTVPLSCSQDFSGRTATVVQAQVPLAQLNAAPEPIPNPAGFQPKSSTRFTQVEGKRLATSGSDVANGVTTDKYGNVYIAGSTFGGPNGTTLKYSDAFVAKYNSGGTLLWTRRLATSSHDSAKGVATDKYGNVYIAGYTFGALKGNTNNGGMDAFVAKYNSGGTRLWIKQPGTAVDDSASGVATDPNGLVYITGKTKGNLDSNPGTNKGLFDAFLIKYDSGSNRLWTQLLGTSADDAANGVVADKYGQIYIAGSTTGAFSGSNNGRYDPFLAKYNSAGALLWTTQQLRSLNDDIAYGVTADPNGLIYITGVTYGNLYGTDKGGSDAFVAKYNSGGGNPLWIRQPGTTANDFAYGVTANPNGLIYIAGNTYGNLNDIQNNGGSDAFVIKYNSGGSRLWTQLLGTLAYDVAYGVTSDPYGLVYIAGSTFGNLAGPNTYKGNSDAFVTKYNSGGTRLWTQQ